MSKKKKEKKEEAQGFDLSKCMNDLKGEPLYADAKYAIPNSPQKVQITDTGETIERVSCLIHKAEEMTYRDAIQQALLADVNAQQVPDMPDKHKRSMLALKMVADTDVKFTSEEITLIKNSAKHDPRTATIVYMRLVELLDPADMED